MNEELLQQFILEGRELVQQAFDDLLGLERDGRDPARIDSAFRAIHTLKGSAGLFDFAPLGQALHAAEDLMAALREGSQLAPATGPLLDCIGAVDDWINAVAATGRLPGNAAARSQDLAGALRAALERTEPAGATLPPDWLIGLRSRDQAGIAQSGVRYAPNPDCFFMGDDPLALVRTVPELVALRVASRVGWELESFDPFACNLVIEALSAAPAETVRDVFRLVPDQAEVVPLQGAPGQPGAAEEGRLPSVSRTLRVETGRVDALADLVGELFVAKNRLAHLGAEVAAVAPGLARALAANQAEIERLAGEMHRALMSVRLTPLGHTLRRLPPLVREIAARLGKQVRFTVEGGGTEADKAIGDGLFEPLLHVLRNAVDHGIEPETVRERAGKPPAGQIRLEAGREGEQVVITVSDDGKGIDPAVLRRTAQARGLIGAASLDAMDDPAVLDLIFLPGFSTAAAVTDVSGRGVGMDAVRTAVHAMGGRVGISGAPGVGTAVRFVVPQAMAVTRILVVEVGDERFGVPIEVIAEMTRVKRAAILPIRSGAAFVLRDRTIPLLRLADMLGRPAAEAAAHANVLVVTPGGHGAGGHRVGIEVDRFGARMDLVLRPLGGLLAGMRGVRGASLLGDGQVLLVLDLAELVG